MKLKEDNGEYYIGQIKNDSKNGIRKEFNKDDSLKYVGTFKTENTKDQENIYIKMECIIKDIGKIV